MRLGATSCLVLVVAVLAAAPAQADDPEWARALVDRLQAAADDPDERETALREAAESLNEHLPDSAPPPSKLAPLLGEIERACRSPVPQVRFAAWAAAVATCSERGLACLEAAMSALPDEEDKPLATGALAQAVAKARCAGAHAAFLVHLGTLWASAPPASEARRQVRGALEAAARCTDAGTTTDPAPAKARAALTRRLEAALRSEIDPTLRQDLLLSLALAPSKPARDLLARWFDDRKPRPEDDLLLVISGLGDTGDPGAVPFLLDRIPDATPAALAACVKALHEVERDALREHVRALFDVLAAGLGKETRFLASIADTKRKEREPLTRRAQALHALPANRGLHALLWKIIDANDDLFSGRKPTPPPRGMIKPSKLGGGNVVTILDWRDWWKDARRLARRR